MSDLRTAAQQALEALEALQGGCTDSNDGTVEAITVWCPEIIDALNAALAEPVQEPVAWIEHEWAGTGLRKLHFEKRDPTVRDEVVNPVWTPLYTAPPKRKPLTEEEIQAAWDSVDMRHPRGNETRIAFARAIERAHGIV